MKDPIGGEVFVIQRDLTPFMGPHDMTFRYRAGLVHYTINGQPVERPEYERRLAAARSNGDG